MIKDACDRKWIIIVLAAVLTAIVGASVQPAQARTDENWVTPETISAGYQHACGVKSDGTLACWGNNDYGQSTPPAGPSPRSAQASITPAG